MYSSSMKATAPTKMVPVQITLTDEEYFELKRRAQERGVTMSRIARELLGIPEPVRRKPKKKAK